MLVDGDQTPVADKKPSEEPSRLFQAMAVPSTGTKGAWEFFRGMRRTLPIKAIRDYYGEKIALYFSFLQHLLHLGYGLPLPALPGIAVQVLHFLSRRVDLTAVRVWVDL